MNIILLLLIQLLDIYLYLIIAGVVASWLIAFGVLNTRNRYVGRGLRMLDAAIEPPMTRLRRVVPPMGGLDLTPLIMMFGIYIVQGLLFSLMR